MTRKTAAALCLSTLFLVSAAPAPKPLTSDRVHFDVQGLETKVHGEARPAVPLPSEPEPGFGAEPANVRFRFGARSCRRPPRTAPKPRITRPSRSGSTPI
jgi:hypothetical protein